MTDIVAGIHAVRAALQAGRVTELHVAVGNRRVRELVDMANAARIPVMDADKQQLMIMAGTDRHQGIVAKAEAGGRVADLDELVTRAENGDSLLLLVLDGVQDPHNLGACLRTADAAGVDAVIVPKDRSSPLTPAARKVAAGGAESVPFLSVTNLARTLERLREAGIWTVGLAGEAGQSLYELDLRGPLALILGAEADGLRRLTRENCDFLAALPMAGQVESLNVSVTAGVCLYEAVRQRA
ncbi:23S rRNA (guanosine(2251)-2'-O)-methyltransferase RlmB [Natronospira bacteriovora]|uniref:23S rRNA (guanosine-2'-O-)-methyltransferase RlmB n=1 Tax=Natronospira bacteriovora TaxID=3069753 RepID=A0ABU0W492_9GAMM|nr:23S rRNA (guanosine(2251)-2'-O)-methyltransferase RlmB [Natronospira sp. AB-CW4]MDQ2068840.1 23S rRNA (guanosine(2251)-2'-O)-methyltransferase RlmB [Natronospira sp. AB-CW4]